jgi:phosphoethanolamine N-methyltransferase
MDILVGTPKASIEEHSAILDSTQYTRESIQKYEEIFGRNFVSTGGLESTQGIVASLNLKPGMQVLDIGSGLGGSAFHMAQEYGAHVHGLDLSHNMLSLAHERLQELKLESLVKFEYGDVLDLKVESVYDVAYSRDAFLHIENKARLFEVIHRALKPNGLLFFTDYCWGEGQHSAEFLAYVAQRGYILHTVKEYGNLIAQAGFINVQALDKTELFGDYLQLELEHFAKKKAVPEIQKSWQEKIVRNQRGEQGWGWFMARKA